MIAIAPEKDTVALAQGGDETAFEEILNVSMTKLRGMLAGQYRLQPTDLDEIIQAATIKAFRKLPAFRNESSFTTWFYIILKNEALDYIKKRKFIELHEQSSHRLYSDGHEDEDYGYIDADQTLDETAASILEKQETLASYRTMIEQIMDELSPHHRDIINLSLNDEKSYKDIAEELGIPIGTVMSRLFFARKNAQQLIIQYARRNAIQLDCLG